MRLVKFIYFCFFWFNNFLDWPMWFIRSAFLHCVVFSNASSNGLPWCMYIDTGCIVLPPLHGVFSNVPTNCLLENIDIHTGCICLIFLQCASSNVSSYCLPERMQSHTGCFCLTLLHCAFSNVPSSCLPQRTYFYTAFVWFFSTVHYQTSPQIACLRGYKVTLVTFVWLIFAVFI